MCSPKKRAFSSCLVQALRGEGSSCRTGGSDADSAFLPYVAAANKVSSIDDLDYVHGIGTLGISHLCVSEGGLRRKAGIVLAL